MMQNNETLKAMESAGLSVYETWMHHCNMGGAVDYLEFDAYLHGLLTLAAEDADLVSRAVDELIHDALPAEESRFNRAPYSWSGSPVGLDVRGLAGHVGTPLPPGAPLELLGEVLGSRVIGRFVAGERP